MKIFFDGSDLRDISAASFKTLPAYKQIGHLLSRAISLLSSSAEVSPELQRLGIGPDDREAAQDLKAVISQINDQQAKVIPSELSGTYYIQTKPTPEAPYRNVAVFKIGYKRAALELQARKLAHDLGLAAHIVPGTFAAFRDAKIEADTTEELWNGSQKIYMPEVAKSLSPLKADENSLSGDESYNPRHQIWLEDDFDVDAYGSSHGYSSPSSDYSPLKNGQPPFGNPRSEQVSYESSSNASTPLSSPMKMTPTDSPVKRGGAKSASSTAKRRLKFEETTQTVVGIIEPFLAQTEEKPTPLQFLQMTICALAIGLRDAKENGYCKSTFFDVEDSMPTRLDPPKETDWTKMPTATHLPYLDNEPNSTAPISTEELQMVQRLTDSWDIENIILNLSKETIQFEDASAEYTKREGKDDGQCQIRIQRKEPHILNGHLNQSIAKNPERRVFTTAQLQACRERLERIQSFIRTQADAKSPITSRELVFAVDPAAKKFYDALTSQPASQLRTSSQRTLDSSGPFHIIGIQSPFSAGIKR